MALGHKEKPSRIGRPKKYTDMRTTKQKNYDMDVEVMEKMLEALEIEHGIVAWALKRVGITYKTHWRLKQEYPDYKDECDAIEEATKCWIAGKLAELIDEKCPQAVIFACKTRLGYSEKTETTVNLNTRDLVDVTAALDEMREAIEKDGDEDYEGSEGE